MEGTENTSNETRVVQPPASDVVYGTSPVFSVELKPDEEVEWQWTHLAGGRSVVTGYTIRKKEPEAGFDFEAAVKDLLWPRRRVGF
jgi:hypothetical protein